ncbi:MAG: CRISPR system precrRNA processing endoribonuclease RAMP protein Cas6 [Acidobacteria bacterium]|nr:CRISPR system precrRNA processing endoribonuclease RAMP protein Cas6 [Acidobacteriota bacterium]
MLLDSFASLELLSIEFELLACQQVSLPSFLGTSLRGAFGESLKQVTCVKGIINCTNYCTSEVFCPYDYLFETASRSGAKHLQKQEDTPNPYMIVPPSLNPSEKLKRFAEGEKLSFGIKLIGKACDYLPYVIETVKELCQKGLTVKRIPFQLSEIKQTSKPESLKSLIEKRLADFNNLTQLKVEFLTPLRLRTSRDIYVGMNAETKLTFDLLVKNLIRRFSLLSRFHGKELSLREIESFNGLLSLTSSISSTNENIYWFDTERYSNRQRARLRFGGLMGHISFIGKALEEFLPLLLAGEYLSIGASTTFGLGRLQILE